MFVRDPNITTREEYIVALRRLYAPLRGIGLVAVLVGVIGMISARPLAMDWLRYIGLGFCVFGWVIIGFVVVQRTRWAKVNRIEG